MTPVRGPRGREAAAHSRPAQRTAGFVASLGEPVPMPGPFRYRSRPSGAGGRWVASSAPAAHASAPTDSPSRSAHAAVTQRLLEANITGCFT